MWRCTVCGYIHEGDDAPDRCPNCGAPKEKFEKLTDDQAQLIQRSRLSNGLHVRLGALLAEVICIGEQGVKDDLDPRCVQIFTQAKELGTMMGQRVKAEIQSHVGKGKWG